ncbi:MAG: hypothetical protein JO097_00925 [Acidobacteriaceae bacterium]|nr:hypothetical protein [Acidobacteriaceae bacterium]
MAGAKGRKRILEQMELIFEVRDAEEGGFFAKALGHSIFTEAETWEELRANAVEAAMLHFEDEPVQLRLVQLQLSSLPQQHLQLRNRTGSD